MALFIEERIDIVLHAGGRSHREIGLQPSSPRKPTYHSAVTKLSKKFQETGSVHDKRRSGRPKTATDEESSTKILAAYAKSPYKSSRQLSY
ncbi:Hypothetical predicted protein [Pelobates cultripes]|uniref:DUF4817 domain-containing protein n=1 Tax=Pelobates cultripes TaxID=61616 RepID=A0AAD1RVD2_PELCU|nr:Hypothetical predicted protein [Pelobates cultripes]